MIVGALVCVTCKCQAWLYVLKHCLFLGKNVLQPQRFGFLKSVLYPCIVFHSVQKKFKNKMKQDLFTWLKTYLCRFCALVSLDEYLADKILNSAFGFGTVWTSMGSTDES